MPGVALSRLGGSSGSPSAWAIPPTFQVPGLWKRALPGTSLFLCFLTFKKYQKSVYQLGFQTLKEKRGG